MKKHILYLCYNREKETKSSLYHLSKCYNISDYTLVVVRQEGDSEVAKLISSISFITTHHLVTKFRVNSYSSINQNVHLGLSFCFDTLNSDHVLILEDDILVSPDILIYTNELTKKYLMRSDFRAVNCFSSEKFNLEKIGEYGYFNYGIGQGWCITKYTWKSLKLFWTGNENMHFDALIEPYIKTGFVCMPSCSRIKNIGWGSLSSHSSQNKNDEFYVKLETSFVNDSHNFNFGYYVNKKMKYTWREDCLRYNGTKFQSEIKASFFFCKYFIKIILTRLQLLG